MAFDITGHPLLSANAPSGDALTAHTRIAEQVLGLSGAALTGDDLEAAKDAIVLQVNFQVDALPDRDWGTVIKEKPFEYITENVGVNPVALRMAGRLIGTGRKVPVAVVSVPDTRPLTIRGAAVEPFSFDIT